MRLREKREQMAALAYEPASAYVHRIVRPKYIVDQNDEETNIVIAPLPTLPIPKGNAGPSMISHLLVSKFVDHQPFYRQVQIFKRQRLEIWLREHIILVPPKSAIGVALAYTLNLWPRLVRYIDDGRFHIDNNLIENSIRPVALGRKNYLFAGSHEAAQQAAVIYSILATCKLHSVEPFAYLTKLLSIIPDHPANQLHTLLPGQK